MANQPQDFVQADELCDKRSEKEYRVGRDGMVQ
jgi:hypothetical protein